MAYRLNQADRATMRALMDIYLFSVIFGGGLTGYSKLVGALVGRRTSATPGSAARPGRPSDNLRVPRCRRSTVPPSSSPDPGEQHGVGARAVARPSDGDEQ